jgi:hypothetical protein
MKLKETFKKQLDTATPKLNRPHFQAQKCEQIAEKFAIEFAEWICEKASVPYIKGTMDKTLEIFKKEKDL